MQNKIMMITYGNSLGKDFKDLKYVLDEYLREVVYGIHILPFYPSSADRGFSPTTYQEVDGEYGTWDDVIEIAKDHEIMADFMINHISRSSEYFKDFLKNKNTSRYKDYFIRYSEFWEKGFPNQEEVDIIYKRKPRAPYLDITFEDGTIDKVWCTFNEEQIDLDVSKKATLLFIRDQLEFLASKGAKVIRLDAFAYAIKKQGSSCFFEEPGIWELLGYCRDVLAEKNVEVLPEIHEHHSIQLKIAEHDYYVYDFALPMLVLHSLYSGTSQRLVNWLDICPRKQYTTLDTHDGIGVVDVKDLMTDEEIEETRNNLYEQGANVKRKYSSAEYNNLDIYQINCTYYSALGNDDQAYLLARAIQFYTPGIPQVYYVGVFAGANDIDLLEQTKQGRDINRHNYTLQEIDQEIERGIVKKLFELMRFRNSHEAFNGDILIDKDMPKHMLKIKWVNGKHFTTLVADLSTKAFTIDYTNENGEICSLSLQEEKGGKWKKSI